MSRDVHIHVDERAAESVQAQEQILRLLAARDGGKTTYSAEFRRIIRELLADSSDTLPTETVTRLAHALNSSILLTFAAATFIADKMEMSSEDVYTALERAANRMREQVSD
jgi:hypothetical protein